MDSVELLRLRHAHIIAPSEHQFVQGMRADLNVVDNLNQYMKMRIAKAKKVRVLTEHGGSLELKISPVEKFVCLSGQVRTELPESLPSGGIVVCPTRADGTFVLDRSPLNATPEEREALEDNPLRLELRRSRLMSIEGGCGDLAKRTEVMLRSGINTEFMGCIVIGTNYAVQGRSPDTTQAECIVPGVSLCFGMHPCAKPVMVRWSADGYYNVAASKTSLDLDGELVIENGLYKPHILKAVGVPLN